mmetsp:Transcript_81073/g.217779  ORF Transcript_81073/g.217779 Transcript_81073/m.217779 type:complete len:110 (+) Transcript_81073:241-570(+)
MSYCEERPAEGPKPCPQPKGDAWVKAYKARRVRAKMADKFKDPNRVFKAMDKDGGGTVDRKEMAMALFQLGIWLSPPELQTLLEVLDRDGGGDIDLLEFTQFWKTHTFE